MLSANYYVCMARKLYGNKFYGLTILCRERKLTDFNFTEPWLIK